LTYRWEELDGSKMALTTVKSMKETRAHNTIDSMFASRYVQCELPKFSIPKQETPKEAAYQIISDELMLDGNPRLNLASFVTTWMEPECDKLIMTALNKNYIDMDEYPITTELQDRCVNMIARLFNAPIEAGEQAVGAGTVGSSEAIMLAGLAFKRKWQNERKAAGKPWDKPNLVTGANVQVCWEKFGRYFEVELREVKLTEDYYVINPEKAVELCDENTICVCAILGSTYNGEFEDVKTLNDLLEKKNAEKGWHIPIHVDAASGGFIAPFIYPDLVWDFRLPLVKSINVSGHKYGLVYAGIGWVVWRNKEDLPEELIFHVNYLGADQPTFTLNFSKGASQVIAQYYQLIRLGFDGYRNIMANCAMNAKILTQAIEKLGRFKILSKEIGVPVVAFSLLDNHDHDEYEISDGLRRYGWTVPAYTMAPDAQHVTLLRVVVREDFSRSLADRLVTDIKRVLAYMDARPSKLIQSVTEAVQQENLELHSPRPKSAAEVKKMNAFNLTLHTKKLDSFGPRGSPLGSPRAGIC
jgi:glutamate decarboxylase